MTENTNEPVEISTRMRPGEWTPESLEQLVDSYQQKLYGMGAPKDEVQTSVETPEDGSAQVHVSWQHVGVHTFPDLGQTPVEETNNSRGHGESIPHGEPTQDSKGLGAVFGDAERSAIDEPASDRSMETEQDQGENEYRVYTSDEGRTFVEDAEPAKE